MVIKLIEVGTYRRFNRVDETPQNAIFVEAVDCLQRGLDCGGDGDLVRRTLFSRDASFGSKRT